MKGLKFLVVGSPIFNDTFSALGANPTQMSWADAQPALASGAVEGQENPMHIFTAAKLHTLSQKFVTRWGYVADPLIFAVNREVWSSWAPQDREIVRESAVEAGKQVFKKAIQPVYEKWRKQIGSDLVKRAEAAVEASGSKS